MKLFDREGHQRLDRGKAEGKPMFLTKAGPNHALHLTASSARSCLASASGSR